MQSQEKDNLIIARFFKEEDVYQQLESVLKKHKVETAIIVSGIGQLKEAELGFFKEKGDYCPQRLREPHELVSLQGFVSLGESYDFHLHAVLSDKDKNTVGGHFISGVVSVTLEIALLKTGIKIKRQIEDWCGLKGMFLE